MIVTFADVCCVCCLSDISTLFLNNTSGRLASHPTVVTPLYAGLMTVNFCLVALWIVVWGHEFIAPASLVLSLVAGTNIVGMANLAKTLAGENQRLKTEQPKAYW